MKLSIIIPVYNVETTLNKCIESVVNQDFSNYELILVDDGSPDRCPQICDRWALKSEKISVIHKKNGGLSDARNAGIDVARGKYITFIDSDDYIGEHTFAPVMDYIARNPEVDILEYPAQLFYGSPNHHELAFPEETVYNNMEAYWFQGRAYQHTYAWNKIYKKELFDEVRFPTGVVFEDIYTLYCLLKKASIVATINSGCYYYCYNPKGITATADNSAMRMLLHHHVSIIMDTQRRDKDFQAYYMQVINIQIDVFEMTGEVPILPDIHMNPKYFNGIQKLKSIASNILGIKSLCKLTRLFHNVWRNH